MFLVISRGSSYSPVVRVIVSFVLSKGEKDLSWIRPTSELKISIINSDDNQNKKQFLLEELYQQHADIAKDIVVKAQAYNDNYYDDDDDDSWDSFDWGDWDSNDSDWDSDW